MAETDPPLLCLVGWYLKRMRGVKLIVYLQDIHPDIGLALGKIADRWPTRLVRRLLHRSYRAADRIVVLSDDMREQVVAWGIDRQRVLRIPNWCDTKQIHPMKSPNNFRERHAPDGKFVVMYSGNLGLCQRLEDVVSSADRLRNRADIQFLFVGGGSLERKLKELVDSLGLTNVRFLPHRPKNELAESLSAADVHLVPLDPRVSSCLMPSKLYGVLASGTPVVAIAPDDCELAKLTIENRVGIVAPPTNPEALADAVCKLVRSPDQVKEMGARARRLAVTQYDRSLLTARFGSVVRELLNTEFGSEPEPIDSSPAIPETIAAAVQTCE